MMSANEDGNLADLSEDELYAASPHAWMRYMLREHPGEIFRKLIGSECRLVRMRYRLVDGRQYSWEEVASILDITEERARQLEIRIMRKLYYGRRGWRRLNGYL